jgi:hypothetical protein
MPDKGHRHLLRQVKVNISSKSLFCSAACSYPLENLPGSETCRPALSGVVIQKQMLYNT